MFSEQAPTGSTVPRTGYRAGTCRTGPKARFPCTGLYRSEWGKGWAARTLQLDFAHDFGCVGRFAQPVQAIDAALPVDIKLQDADGVEQRWQLALVDALGVQRVQVPRSLLAIAGGRFRWRAGRRRACCQQGNRSGKQGGAPQLSGAGMNG